MSDQASELRKLVLRAMRDSQPAAGPAPRLILFLGGQTGAGVTTLAVNSAIAMAEQGLRIVLIDADSHHPGVARLCGLDSQRTVADVLVARRDIHEALQLGPAGIQVIPGLWRPGHEPEVSSMALERLMLQITKLGRHADCVLVDVGNESNELVRRLAQAANDVVVVTTPEVPAVMDSYARIKVTLSGHTSATPLLVVNRWSVETQITDVHRRIDKSCQRFLGHGVELLGVIPEDNEVTAAGTLPAPFLLARPQAAAAKGLQPIVVRLSSRGQWEPARVSA
jgi:flagellar biosynthesis protein FlhG